ncbi:MAG: T9SS type A sorting domain-containing protein, partial [Cyclobacteriaceae bacterium]|nr:T9SS type A sorting domain-containing protein [Cyclobacteriaceae bacterium]
GNFDLSSNWNVSGLITKVIVDQNVTFDVNQPIDVLMDVHNGAILNLNSDFNIKLDSVFSGSTINFSAMTQIPARSYGNLIVSGTGLKILNGNKAIVTGDISILDGAGIKGKSANSSTIELYGSMTNQGSTLFPSDDNLVGLSIKGLNSTINYSGLLNLYKLDILPNAQVQFNSGNPAPKINIGTLNGGGIIGGNGSKILMGNGILEVKDFGEFNSGNSNLILNVNGGSIIYNSNSSASSYLRFDTAGKILKNLDLNTLSGNVFIESPLEVTNAIKIKNGKLHAQGNLTLVSNSTHTTSVKSLEGNGQILGTVNAQRYLSNKGAIWRYLSTPVSGISVADWQTSIPITGNFSGSSPQSIYPSLYYYDEPNGGWIFYPDDGGSNSALLEPGRGYSLWMWNGTTPQTIQNRGTLNQGNINFTVTSGTGSPDDGWNLMGNPYASDIIWGNTGWTSNNVSNFVWVRNNHADGSYSFEIWDKSNNTGTLTNGVVAAGQSFWIQAIGPSPTLAISEVSKSDTDESKELYRTETLIGELIEITLIEGLNTDKTFVKLATNSSDAYFGMSDAIKKKNSTLNLSTLSTDQVSLAINELDDDFCQKQVPLLIEDVSLGSHNLLFEGISSFSNGRISLVDHFLNTSELILSDGYTYIFNVTESEESFKNRFELLIERYEVDLSSRVISGSNIFCESEKILSITVMESQAHVLYSVREKNSRKVLSGKFEGNGAELTLLINVDELSSQTEELEILAGFPGCEVKVLPATSTVTVQPEPVVSVFEHIIQTCSNTLITLNASGGDYYKWENTLTGEFFEETGELLQIVPTDGYQVVKVTAFTNSGCSSNNYELIELYSSSVEKPAIVVEDNKLIVFSEMSLQWYLNGEVIEGENSTYLYPKNSGKYTVSASNSYCTMFSDELEYLVTGMPDHKKDKLDVKIYPNPSDGGIITLSGSTLNDSNVEIKIYDTFGRLLFNKAIQSEEYEKGYFINEQLSKGVYLIKVIQNNSLTETKWVVY